MSLNWAKVKSSHGPVIPSWQCCVELVKLLLLSSSSLVSLWLFSQLVLYWRSSSLRPPWIFCFLLALCPLGVIWKQANCSETPQAYDTSTRVILANPKMTFIFSKKVVQRSAPVSMLTEVVQKFCGEITREKVNNIDGQILHWMDIIQSTMLGPLWSVPGLCYVSLLSKACITLQLLKSILKHWMLSVVEGRRTSSTTCALKWEASTTDLK